jgi:chemotaxis signal transduction protein
VTGPAGFRRFLELGADDRARLRERAADLSKVPPAAAAGVVELLEVSCGGESFALPLDAVAGVTELTSLAEVPNPPRLVRGMVSVQGEVLWGIDLSRLAGGGGTGLSDLRRVVVVTAGNQRLALLAERALGVRQLPLSSFRPDPVDGRSFVKGLDESFLTLLDPAQLIAFVFAALEGA